MKRGVLQLILGIVLSFNAKAQMSDSIPQIDLREVSVIANNTIHKKNSDIFIITKEMRERYSSVFDILKILPNVSYNDISNTIKVFNNDNVLFTVNNKPEPKDIMKTISPERIQKIELFTNPARRFKLLGYDYVLNLTLKNEYIGSDISVLNTMMITPNYNKKNYISNEQPGVVYSYCNKKFSISGIYGYADIIWNYPIEFEKKIGEDKIEYYTSPADKHNPNNKFKNKSHALNISSDYRFSDKTLLSFVMSYLNENLDESTNNNISTKRDNKTVDFHEINEQRNLSNDIKISAVLESKLSQNIDLHVDVGYNYQKNNMDNGYIIPNIYKDVSHFRGHKRFLSSNVDLMYSLNKLGVNVGAFSLHNIYEINNRLNEQISKDKDSRLNFYASGEYQVSEALSGMIGATLVNVSRNNNVVSKNKFYFLPNASVSYNPDQTLSLRLNYETKIEYPKLTQLSMYSYMIDDNLRYEGNPCLSSAIIHEIGFVGQYKNLTLNGGYIISPSSISDIYSLKSGNEIILTNINAKYQKWWAGLSYKYKINSFVSWKNGIEFSKNYRSNDLLFSSVSNLAIESHLDWWLPGPKILLTADYSRSMYKDAMLQGQRMKGFDIYQFSLQRGFFKNKLAVSLSYFPPIKLGRQVTQTTEIKSNYYQDVNRMNLSVYNNMIIFKVSWRFSRGKMNYPKNYDFKFDEEKIDKRGLL